MTVLPRETWPSPPMTTLPLRRTETMVVKGEISTRRGIDARMRLIWGRRQGFSTGQVCVGCNLVCTGCCRAELVRPLPALWPNEFGPTVRGGQNFDWLQAAAMTLRRRTGMDFAAGTLLRLAWCQTGSSTLHSG